MYKTFSRLNCFICLISLLIFAGILHGQGDQVRLNAEKSQAEADELFSKNTSASREEAKKKYLENLPIWESLNEIEKQAQTLHKLVEISYLSSDYKKSLEYSQKALPLFQKSGNRTMEAETLSNIGGFLDILGQTREALPYLFQALEILKELNDNKRQAVVLNTIGISYSNIGEMRNAIDYLQKSLVLRREANDKAGEARTLINLGTIYDDTGEKRRAAEYYEQGLVLGVEQKDLRTQAIALNNLGFVWHHLGQFQKSYDYYQKALEVRRQAGDKRGEATTLNNIGTSFEAVGELQTAKEFLERALQIYQELGLKRNEARSFGSLGAIYSRLGDKKKSLELYQKALEIHQAIGNKEGQSTILRNIALIYNEDEKFDKSLELLQESLKLAEEIEDAEAIADALMPLGQTFEAKKDLKKAEESYIRAAKVQRESEIKEDLLETLYHYSRFLEKVERRSQAIENMQEAMLIIEDLRNSIALQSFRAGYFAEMQKYFGFYLQLLVSSHKLEPKKGYDILALKVSESARARSLLDSLGENRRDIRANIPKNLLEDEQILRQTINAKETQRIQAIRQKSDDKAALYEKELTELLRQYRDLQRKMRETNPQFASLNNPEPLNLQEIQAKVLDENSVLLEYFVGEERSFLFFVTKEIFEIIELPKREIIEAEIRTTIENLKSRAANIPNETPANRTARLKKSDADLEKNLAQISQRLIFPVAEKIKNKRLLIVASDVLQYVPFAALKNQNAYLIETNEIVNLPSASVVPFLQEMKRREKNAKNLITIFADPVFSKEDVRLKTVSNQTSAVMREAVAVSPVLRSDFSRLRFSRTEAEAISALAEANQRFVALDFAANLKTVTSETLQNSRIIHLATHGIVNSQFPELSSIIFSLVNEKGEAQEGFLRLNDVYNLRLNADLVVLSACETALGKEIKGEGIVGLTRGFMFAGAPSVVASLWQVEDRATADLMKRFYQRMLRENLPPSNALRGAQISMLKEKNSAHPFYWAGFTLQGDWK